MPRYFGFGDCVSKPLSILQRNMSWRDGIRVALPLVIVTFCIFEFVLLRQQNIFREVGLALFPIRWMLLLCLLAWCSGFFILTFNLNDWPLIGFLFITIATCVVSYATQPIADALILLFGVALGKALYFALNQKLKARNRQLAVSAFLLGLVSLFVFSVFWHLDTSINTSSQRYCGPRWMGLWNNPNIYGILMGVGMVLAAGLFAGTRGAEFGLLEQNRASSRWLLQMLLLIAVGVMGVGWLFSYSRGAWVGTAVGLLYLAKIYGKFRGRWLLPVFLLVVAAVVLFWHTPRTAPWYFQRLDMSRGSVTHRLAAWKAGFKMMRDYPLGVGWNKALSTYQEHYSPPTPDAAVAIITNDYLMLGTQLGIPSLVCFITYVTLCLRSPKRKGHIPESVESVCEDACCGFLGLAKIACRAGALAMLVAFWFDGGLFKLPTAAVFWPLLELGAERQN